MTQPKEIKKFEDILQSLKENREKFYSDTENIKEPLADVFNLYLDTLNLVKGVALKDDDEILILETLNVSFRRIISSFVLLESGLFQESRMLLRNFLEYALIAIDITYNPQSLIEWKKTINDSYDDINNYNDWYFKPSKIVIERIRNNPNLYPKEEAVNADFMLSEWKKISNEILHAHSRVQTKNILKENSLELLAGKTTENYKKDFLTYIGLLVPITQQLIFIPKYQKKISDSKELALQSGLIAGKFEKYQKIIGDKKIL